MVPLVTLVVVFQERHVHPPFARGFVAKENDVILVVADLYVIALEIGAFQGGDVVLSHREAFDEIPDHLGNEVGRA